MPRLKFYNRLWRIGGDDLWLPGFCSTISRVFYVVLLIVASCFADKNSSYFLPYLILSILLTLSVIVSEFFIISASMVGTMTESETRDRSLSNRLFYRLLLYIPQVMLGAFGIAILSVYDVDFSVLVSMLDYSLVVLMVILQLGEVLLLAGCGAVFSASASARADSDYTESVRRWEERMLCCSRLMHCCLCDLFGGSRVNDQLNSVADTFALFFHDEASLDVLASDVLTGILLLRKIQQKPRLSKNYTSTDNLINRESFSQRKIERGGENFISNTMRPLESDWESVESAGGDRIPLQERELLPTGADLQWTEEASYCIPFAVSMYSHLLALYMYPVSAPCTLCCLPSTSSKNKSKVSKCLPSCCLFRSCLSQKKSQSDESLLPHREDKVVFGDNCLKMNEAGVIFLLSGTNTQAELKFASFHNDLSIKPYAIFYDAAHNRVIIGIRGTLSLEDCITDANCSAQDFAEAVELWGHLGLGLGVDREERRDDGKREPTGRSAHSGMLQAALRIRKEIESFGILDNLMTSNSDIEGGVTPELLVTGHSLGAGAAVLLSLLLKAKYPHLRCWAFGAPGSVLDPTSARQCASFVTSVVLGDDMVCRLSFHTLIKFREQILDCICRARVNKATIAKSIFSSSDSDQFLYNSNEVKSNAHIDSIREFIEKLKLRVSSSKMAELVIPGRILHLKKCGPDIDDSQGNGLSCKCCTETKYSVFESNAEHFKEIEVSVTMALDHLPDKYEYSLKKLRKLRPKHFYSNKIFEV